MRKLLSQIIAAVAGLWLAVQFVPGVKVKLLSGSNFFGFMITTQWQLFLLLGIILGLLNFFVKPILDAITFPLRIITLGLFSIITGMVILWIVDILFKELSAPFLWPLLWTTLIIWVLNHVIQKFVLKEEV